jgi:hypothetical protein
MVTALDLVLLPFVTLSLPSTTVFIIEEGDVVSTVHVNKLGDLSLFPTSSSEITLNT